MWAACKLVSPMCTGVNIWGSSVKDCSKQMQFYHSSQNSQWEGGVYKTVRMHNSFTFELAHWCNANLSVIQCWNSGVGGLTEIFVKKSPLVWQDNYTRNVHENRMLATFQLCSPKFFYHLSTCAVTHVIKFTTLSPLLRILSGGPEPGNKAQWSTWWVHGK